MPRGLQNSVVVITGASSGIGRATALAFAESGASVVVAARRGQLLDELAMECEQFGRRAMPVPTDVSDFDAVRRLGQRTMETFGRIDTWVNNHGVAVFGRFEEIPLEDFRRVLEVDFFGAVYGARVALPIFQEQGQGVLINTGSMLSLLAEPYLSAYVAAKHAIRGLSMSLRQELMLAGAKDIHVSTVMPATIDTPFFQHAGNYTGRGIKAMPPVYTPERVANTILEMAQRPKPEVFVGNVARQLWMQQQLAPQLTEREIAIMADKLQLYKPGDQPTPPTSGNLFEPMAEGTSVRGGWQSPSDPVVRRLITGAAVALPAFLVWRWLRQRPQARPGMQLIEREAGLG
jgi:NAD(P)-dependent dehydrogenase (short-subunit alcohol dehydrogenase family)